MSDNNKYFEETERFIKDVVRGKFTERPCENFQWQELRYDYSIIENVFNVEDSIMLYGLSNIQNNYGKS